MTTTYGTSWPKVAAFPDVLPVLVARHIHYTTYRMFKDIGAIGHDTRIQYFSSSIDETDFKRVMKGVGIGDAVRVNPGTVSPKLAKFFSRTGPDIAAAQLERWARAAEVVARYEDLRATGLAAGDRQKMWRDFTKEIIDEGLYSKGGWGPRPFEPDDDDDDDDYEDFYPDYGDYVDHEREAGW